MSLGISKKFLMAAMIALGVPGFLACEDKGTGGAGPGDLGTAERGGKKKDKDKMDAGTGGSGAQGSSSGLTGSGTGTGSSGSSGTTDTSAASLAVLGAAAVYQGIGSPFASAAPRPAPPSQAMTPTTEQSLPVYPANADADVGPGQCEPVLVGAP